MGFRCLLSHDFGEPELEREREEQGNEVVITVNEVKTCVRCGERRIVSENTEVTSIDQLTATADETEWEPASGADETAVSRQSAAGSAGDDTVESAGTARSAGTPPSDTGITIDDSVPHTDDAEVLTDDSDDTDDAEQLGTAEPANMTVDDVEAAAAESVQADDDGVILSDDTAEPADADTDEATDSDREPGEWPAYDDSDDSDIDDRQWPDVSAEDEGFSAEDPPEEQPEDMTFGGGFTPEITTAEAGSVADRETELSFTRAEESSVDFEPTVDDIQTEFYCPECGLARQAGNSSMRAGDICPECKRGYIGERQL